MKVLSLFSGIGGFDLGFERAGMEVVGVCEIDKHAQKILQRHFPNATLHTDVRKVSYAPGTIDLICGGFPCQDLSLAGKRRGLAGERSGLWFEFQRIIDECRPKWVVIENVPGLLSSNNGADFWVIIQWLERFGYGVGWRVLDSQYFGLAQRRKRVFVVASLGDPRGCTVLLESSSMQGNAAEGKEAWEDDSDEIGTSIVACGQRNDGTDRGPDIVPFVIRDGMEQRFHSTQTAPTITVLGTHMVSTPIESDKMYIISDFDETVITTNNLSPTLTTDSKHLVSTPIDSDTFIINDGYDESVYTTGIVPTLTCIDKHMVSVPVQKISPTLVANGSPMSGDGQVKEALVMTFQHQCNHIDFVEEKAQALTVATKESVLTHNRVRRLTPTECERLQGFPDGWTSGQADTARYKQLGNAVSVPVAEWIGKRIMQSEHDKMNSRKEVIDG